MSKEAGLIIGTIIFVCLGIVAAIAFHIYVGMRSPAANKSANQRYLFVIWLNRVSLVSVIIAAVSMWIMWACTYMHQMNPLIQPILMVKKWKQSHIDRFLFWSFFINRFSRIPIFFNLVTSISIEIFFPFKIYNF